MLERTALEPKCNFCVNLWEGLGSPVIEVTVKKDTLSLCVLKFFPNFGITDKYVSKLSLRKGQLHRRHCDNHIVKEVLKSLRSNVNTSGKIPNCRKLSFVNILRKFRVKICSITLGNSLLVAFTQSHYLV